MCDRGAPFFIVVRPRAALVSLTHPWRRRFLLSLSVHFGAVKPELLTQDLPGNAECCRTVALVSTCVAEFKGVWARKRQATSCNGMCTVTCSCAGSAPLKLYRIQGAHCAPITGHNTCACNGPFILWQPNPWANDTHTTARKASPQWSSWSSCVLAW